MTFFWGIPPKIDRIISVSDFTLINLATDTDGSLVVTRLHKHYEPVVATIGNVEEVGGQGLVLSVSF